LLFNRLQITTGPDMVETFEFDPHAGMALKSATDMAGNTTHYEYTDTSPLYHEVNHPNSFKVAAPIDLFKYYNDPTAKINALGERTEYEYDEETRVMTKVTLKIPSGTGHVPVQSTKYALATAANQAGLRTTEEHYDHRTLAAGTLVAQTDFAYANATFPAFMTKKTVKKLQGDPSWASDIVTTYLPDT